MARYGDLGTQYFDDAGDPLVNGKVFFYETGTTTLKTTYADVDFAIPNTNPVILTAAGRQPNIFFDGVAKAILATSAGTQILVRDPVGDTAESFGNPWIASKRYSANDVVQGSDGQYYVSLINGNVNNNPVTTTGNWTFLYSVEWSAGTTYKEGSVITYQNLLYQSLQDSNINKNPLTETTYWVLISLAYVSTTTYTAGQNVVGPDGVFYTALRTTIGDTPASSPSDWVGTSAAAAASATAAAASATAAAASASSASTSATNAATSASTASTQATNAAASAATATTQASNASTSASNAATSETNAAASASTASTQASNASTSATNAAASATSATASASTATTQASNASTSASNAATSASNAATSETNAAASASTATTQATAASASASSASTSATNASNSASAASSSASAASTSASNASTSASSALTSANNATTQANAASASAAAAAAIVDISSVTTFTNPLARAVQVAITAATSASNGIQQLTNTQNNFGTGNFALQWRGSVPDWTPAANVILLNKHDGTNGYILTLLTTGFLRLTINGFNYDSSVATGMTDNYVAIIDVDITRETATAAGSVTFTLNGVQLGTALAIAVPAEKVTNGTFDTDITGWTANSGGTSTWNSGKLRIERTSANTSAYQLISFSAGETRSFKATITHVTGATTDATLTLSTSTNVALASLAVGNELLNGASGTSVLSYTSPTAQSIYLHANVYGGNGTYDYDVITSVPSTYSVDNTSSLYVCGTSAVRSASQWFSHRLFNRAKTVAENLGMFVNGMASADVGASQTATFTGDFSTADGFVTITGTATVTANVDGVSDGTTSKDNCLRIDKTAVAGSTGAAKTTGTLLPNMKTAWARLFVYIPAGQAYIDGFVITRSSTISAATTIFDGTGVNGQWVEVSGAAAPISANTANDRLYIHAKDGASTTISASAVGELFYITGVVFGQAGITSELLAQNAQTDNGQVLDSSGNKQHALLPAAGASIMGDISARRIEVRWTNTWAATSELQYVGGVNQAIFPLNHYIESLVVIPEGATLTGFTIGDGSNASYYGTVNGTITSGVAIYVQLDKRVHDGTNRKLTITPMGAFTGNINTTLVGTELERK